MSILESRMTRNQRKQLRVTKFFLEIVGIGVGGSRGMRAG
jgi:hypothetical protein